ncbi:SH3 domain-containing protein [Bartonella sp. DGB2]|uniref:SH3 domain-containing protein n=1 Tax=Bartonella sp. DGB2 TaxID=3388426 RepID=UPI0039900C72
MVKFLSALFLATAFCSDASAWGTEAFSTVGLNLRMGPSIRHHILSMIPAGQLLNVRYCQNKWCHVIYGKHKGWVAVRYLAFNDSNSIYQTYHLKSSDPTSPSEATYHPRLFTSDKAKIAPRLTRPISH